MKNRISIVLTILLVLGMVAAPATMAAGPVSPSDGGPVSPDAAPVASHRLIVQLESPCVAAWSHDSGMARLAGGKLDLDAAVAQSYLNQLVAEQDAFVARMSKALPTASVAEYIDELGTHQAATYQVVFNGMAIDPGSTPRSEARRVLSMMPGVRNVALDYARVPMVYTSTALINAPAVWGCGAVGGRENGGAGVKVASMDGGLHHEAPMFSGEGYDYPADFPAGGLGLKANNNGKIIASRAYFRTFDPPAAGDENPWPGMRGTSHGTHTGSTAAGNIVDAEVLGFPLPEISGVAPGAWVMSYRVFYHSITADGSFHDAEGIAALEDIVRDGADVLNNSWGGGPGSVGGEFDAIDAALINATKAGIFVSMSTGNAGPGSGTTDHPSSGYINVAASTTTGTLSAGRLSAVSPDPEPTVPAPAQGQPFGDADFGAPLPMGETLTYEYVTSDSVDPVNLTGCQPWDGQPFEGKAALISRGDCYFSDKVRNAEQAGAEFVVVYNNDGDELISMGCGDECSDITISSIFVSQSTGEALVQWFNDNPDGALLEVDLQAFQAGAVPDRIVAFSSRGPGVGNVLKPDIAAPGSNIVAQGYGSGDGEDRHLGWGQASGTSMAAPHVAGAAALIRQARPDWTNAQIKSAMMSTSKYMDMYNWNGTPAQPLDMGAGRLDLTNVLDPGVFLSPPSLSFGMMKGAEVKTMTFEVCNISGAEEQYDLSTLFTGDGFDATTPLTGCEVSPASVTLAADESAEITVTFDAGAAPWLGDNQGYVVLSGEAHEAHLPVWARVAPDVEPVDVLLIDNDFSLLLGEPDYPDYTGYYTRTLEALNLSYDVWEADAYFANPTTIPPAAILSMYRAVIYFTGNNYNPDGTFTVSTPLTELDSNILTEYANNGGTVIVMGQDAASVMNSLDEDNRWFFYGSVLGGKYLQDSITGYVTPTLPIMSLEGVPTVFSDLAIDCGAGGDGADNQFYIDEIASEPESEPDSPERIAGYTPILKYLGGYRMEDGVVAMAHREQPSLESPGVKTPLRAIYTAFGLEGVNNDTGGTTRELLLERFLDWAWDESTATVEVVDLPNASNLMRFEAALDSDDLGLANCSYRWDFGDGSPIMGPYESKDAAHKYAVAGRYNVRVEVTNGYGNVVIGEAYVNVTVADTYVVPLPLVFQG